MPFLSRAAKIPLSRLERGLFNEKSRSACVLFIIIAGFSLVIWAFLVAWGCSRWETSIPVLNANVCPSFTGIISPLLVALGFWLVSLFAWLGRQKSTTSIFYLLVSGILSSGLLSSMGIDGGGRVFFILLAWLAPFLIRFHKALSEKELRTIDRAMILVFYFLALLGSLPWLFLRPTALKTYGLLGTVDSAVRGILIISICVALYVAIQDYRAMAVSAARRKLRVVVLGTILGFPPFVLLSLIPNTLRMNYHVPFSYTFPFLLLGPALFLYSIYRYRLVWLEDIIHRSVAYYLLLISMASLALYSSNILIRQMPTFDLLIHVWTWIASLIALSLCSVPAWKAFHRLAFWALYGEGNRFSSLIEQMAVSLSIVVDPREFCRVIYEDLSNYWPISGCALFTMNGSEYFCCTHSIGLGQRIMDGCELPEDGTLARYLATNREVQEASQLLKSLKRHGITLSEEEMHFLLSEKSALWVPLVSDYRLQGLLILKPCQPENYLTTEDRRMFQSLIFQGGIAIHRFYLDREVIKQRQELDQAYRRLVFAREEERRRLARELHDQVIQPLAAHHYALSKLKQRAVENDQMQFASLQKEISAMIRGLRNQCSELRPPALDNLGLVGALQSVLNEYEKRTNTKILFHLDENQAERLPDIVELCAFRVLQEALANVQKHAQARRVEVSLRIGKTELDLIIEDDGQGFSLPDRIERFTQQNHFGLAGLKERAELVGGNLEIHSIPGHGCQLFLQVPLSPADEQYPDGLKGGEACQSES
jgi:signal transduction histidine kinase